MQMQSAAEQVTWSDLGLWSGKTSPEHFPATKAKISAPCSKKRRASSNRTPLFLDLRAINGGQADASWETDGRSLGAYSMRSFGECPSVAVESRLSWILEDKPPQKYCLSAKACVGILRRATTRGKELPPELKQALERRTAGATARCAFALQGTP